MAVIRTPICRLGFTVSVKMRVWSLGSRSALMCMLQDPEVLLIEVSSSLEVTLKNHGRKIFLQEPPHGSELDGWECR